MFNQYQQPFPPAGSTSYPVAASGTLLGKVLGLLGFTFVFTALGAFIAPYVPGGILLPVILSFVLIFALQAFRERAPLNLALLYLFATVEGVLVGSIVSVYLAQGMNTVVLNAAGTTAAVTLIAAFVGTRIERDLTRLRTMLFFGLLAVIIASVIGLFLNMTFLGLAISAVGALIFTGLLLVDFQRVSHRMGTEGDAIMMTVSIYLDIVNLFLSLLRIMGATTGGGSSSRRS